VDVCVTRHQHIGARAVWEAGAITELFVTFAEADAIGLSAIAAAVATVPREGDQGLRVICAPEGQPVLAPIAPGVLAELGVTRVESLAPGTTYLIEPMVGSVALDGEREIELDGRTPAFVRIDTHGPLTLDVPATLAAARDTGALPSISQVAASPDSRRLASGRSDQ